MDLEQVEFYEPTCILCSSDKADVILETTDNINGLPGIFSIVRCVKCGLERTSPLPTIDTMGFYYPDSYSPYSSVTAGKRSNSDNLVGSFKRLLGYHEKILPRLPEGAHVFEFGCAAGDYLLLLKDLGYRVQGQDLSLSATGKAKEKGLDVSCGPLEQFSGCETKFDLIVGWMVVEHLHDPINALKILRNMVSTNGYLVFSVPERRSANRLLFGKFCYDLHLPNHVHHFDRKNLSKMLENAGWKIEKIRWQANSTPLLRSFEAYTEHLNIPYLQSFALALRTERKYRFVRHFLNLSLKWTKLSGRVEVTCRIL